MGQVTVKVADPTTGKMSNVPVVCAGWEPILVSHADVLTDETRNAILSHDEFGAKMGCWKAPAKKGN